MSHRPRVVLFVSALLLSSRPGASQSSARPSADAGVRSRPLIVSYGCSASGTPFGAPDISIGLNVDLARSSWTYVHIETARGGEPVQQTEGPRAIQATTLQQIRTLVERMLVGTNWPTQPAISEGMACSLSIREPAGTGSLVSVQRQSTNAGDVPDLLIRALVALRPHGIQP